MDLKDRAKGLWLKKRYDELDKNSDNIVDKYQDYLSNKKNDYLFDIDELKQEFYKNIEKVPISELTEYLLSEGFPFIMGLLPIANTSAKLKKSLNEATTLPFLEYTFLRSIITPAHNVSNENKIYQYPCGFIFDDLTEYFDGTRPSRMELILNSDFKITEDEKLRAKRLINKIINNKISKYNNQPIYTPSIGRKGVKKVLVIDQSYRDFSISKGCADDSTFEKMLDSAINENPDADILIKTHPDAMGKESTKVLCYYQRVKEEGNIYKITFPISPISMIEYVDKVYVCSSQFGFEALMCGKEVHTFGMPFYANWGLTIDAQKCKRRTRKRTLEELFYVAYILMSAYINPDTNKPCEIEDAIDYLIKYRTKYFKENNIACDK